MTPPQPLPPLPRLYRESFDDVWRILRRLGVPEDSLEDAVQDVFVVVHRRRDTFEGNCAVRTWLFGIARRVASRYRRTAARTQRRHQALAAATPATADAHELISRHEAWLALERFLAELERPQREAFVLGELQRLNRRELGAALGISPNTAYSRLRAARARFSETFAAGRPSSHTVLAAGRHPETPPAQAHQRVWLALSGSLGLAPSATVGTVSAAWGLKAVLTSVALAGAMLGVVAEVAPGPRRPASAASETTLARASARVGPPPPAPVPLVAATERAPLVPPVVASLPASRLDARRIPSSARPRGAGTAAPAPPADPPITADRLAVEAALLRTARAALARSSHAEALDALQEHRRRFAQGVLAEERDASIIRAECALGRDAQAQREAQRFVEHHPRSAYLEALAGTCVDEVIQSSVGGDR